MPSVSTECAVAWAMSGGAGGVLADKNKKKTLKNSTSFFVGVPGFELGTSCSQSRRANQLRYTPRCLTFVIALQRYDFFLFVQIILEEICVKLCKCRIF